VSLKGEFEAAMMLIPAPGLHKHQNGTPKSHVDETVRRLDERNITKPDDEKMDRPVNGMVIPPSFSSQA
jgi:hypothetical protein